MLQSGVIFLLLIHQDVFAAGALHYIDIMAMCCRVISPSFYFCSFSCVIYVQSTLHVVVNF